MFDGVGLAYQLCGRVLFDGVGYPDIEITRSGDLGYLNIQQNYYSQTVSKEKVGSDTRDASEHSNATCKDLAATGDYGTSRV